MMDDSTRLHELLSDHATGDLSADGEAELRQLLSAVPGAQADREEFERLAGELAAALLKGGDESLPRELAARIVSEGQSMLAEPREASGWRRRRWVTWSGWAAAAVLAGWLLLPSDQSPGLVDPSQATLADVRESLLEEQAIAIAWSSTADPAAVEAEGDVVWSQAQQTGVMRIRGLAANDANVAQYQLWIFDTSRDERFPVDGGVFDIPEGAAEILIPIRARLDVRDPSLFAVTVEPPGGVVVSNRERIVLTASIG